MLDLKTTLDRDNSRWLLSILASLWSLFKYRKPCFAYFCDGAWVHRYLDGAVVDTCVKFGTTINEYISNSKDIFEWMYIPRQGDIVFDIGSGVGSETYYFSKLVGSSGKVISIEANPRVFNCLRKFCVLNDLTNVIPLNIAVADGEYEVIISDPTNHEISSIVSGVFGYKVPCTRIDTLCQSLGIDHIDCVKMNIEGAEILALSGMAIMLKSTQHLIISCHDFLADETGVETYRTKKAVIDLLSANNFDIMSRNDPRAWVDEQVIGVAASL